MNIKKLIVSAALLVGIVTVSASAIDLGVGTVKGDVLRMRSSASMEASVVGYADMGEKVAVLGESNGWYSVYYNGVSGYMKSEYLAVEAVDNIALGTAYIKGSDVRMRAQPTTDSAIVAEYDSGSPLNIIGINNGWYKVTTGAGTGYVRADFVTFAGSAAAAPAAAQPSTTAEALVECAKQYLGVPYVWGGTSPSGFDCSGLIYYVCKQYDISLERVACNQYYNNGTYVEKSELQPGDLVFFSSSSSSIGHVGMYIGNDEFIHASSGSRYCVMISGLSESNYVARYVGAKRIA